MTGNALDWKKGCKLHFGEYAQVHKERNVTNTLDERTQGVICLGPTGNLQGTYHLFLLHSGKKITRGKFTGVPTPTIVKKRVAEMDLAKKQNEGLIFENRTRATVNNILTDDEANEAFKEIDRNIAGVEREAEIKELSENMPQPNNNQYTKLEGEEEDEENDTESTGVDNDGKITGVRHNDQITGVDSNNKSTGVKSESGSTVATDEADEISLIEEATAESERDIVEGTDILAGTETETKDTHNENAIHTDFQVHTV